MQTKKALHSFALVAMIASLLGCARGVDQSQYDQVLSRCDSLENVNKGRQAELDDLVSFLGEVSDCVDSISWQEQQVALNHDPESGRRFSRREILERIQDFSALIERQRNRIAALNDSLKQTDNVQQAEKITAMIDYLNKQLEQKEAQIRSLKAEIASNKRNIENLNSSIASLNESNATLTNENQTLDRALVEQTNLMNEGYFLAASKKELQEKGLLKSGFLKKGSFDPSNVRLSECRKIDIRSFNDEVLDSKKPKLLTQAPAGSYMFEDAGDGKKRLVILDTVGFWSLSNVVIIQL